MKIVQSILTKNDCYTTGKKITVKGLMLHSVGCPQPSAQVFVKNWNKAGLEKCVHAFIDGNTGDVYQCLPWNHRGWHSGKGSKGSANDTHIGVEMCEPGCIKYTGGVTFTCSDTATAKAVAQRTYDTAVQLFAHLCKQYNLNPLGDGVIVGHKEGNKLGIASNHGDPEHLWNQLKMGYTMDTFRKAVKNAMGTATTTTESDVRYHVQVGVFSQKSGAEAMLAKVKAAGFDGFITTSGKTAESKPVEPEITFKVGDMVKMSSDATVYGKTIKFSSWVYKSTLFVRSVSGNKIVVSTQRTGDITGAVDKKYLILV